MKIEKLNDNQIRCTLDRNDLTDRNIELSELAYGNDKVRSLFKDMMAQANDEVGFNAEDNTPIVVEAIPVAHGGIVLIITKVEDPDELDARFARFTAVDEDRTSSEEADNYYGADEILDIFKKITDGIAQSDRSAGNEASKDIYINLTKIFVFDNLNTVISFAETADDDYIGENILYKNTIDNRYYLVLDKGKSTPAALNKICNLAGEYGHAYRCSAATPSFLKEHFDTVIKSNAINILKNL